VRISRELLLHSGHPLMMIARSIVIGGTGAYVFWLIGMPLPWLTGALLMATVFNLSGIPVGPPSQMRDFLMAALGISMGTGITHDAFQVVWQWPISIIGLALTVAAITAASGWFLQRFAGWDRATAMMASLPGALSYVIALLDSTQADPKRVAIAQSLRVFLLVFLLPPVLLLGHEVNSTTSSTLPHMSLLANTILAVGTGALGWCFERLRIPAGYLSAGMLLTGAAHLMDLTTGRLPVPVQVFLFICFGCYIGNRFLGATWRELGRYIMPSMGSVVLMGLISLGASVIVAQMIEMSLAAILLAFVPGGLEAMVIIAFSLDLEPVYVTTHHFMRMLMLAFTMPFVVRMLKL
jgi:uncharacterized protein